VGEASTAELDLLYQGEGDANKNVSCGRSLSYHDKAGHFFASYLFENSGRFHKIICLRRMFQEFAFTLPSVEPVNNDHVAWTQIFNLVLDWDACFRHFLSRKRRERSNLNPFKINKFGNKLIDKKKELNYNSSFDYWC